MARWRALTVDFVAKSPRRIYKAVPAVLLGVILNIVDAVSTGLLVFPPARSSMAFGGLQVQAMSMYIMSTLMSQIALTFGGSLFPGVLGSMLIEVLPFLRRIATSIRDVLGDDNPALLPTVMAAYTMTSFLIGISFTVLGLLRSGRVVAYFPRTVLTGAIGAIGVSLFVLGLELSLPALSDALTLKSARLVLFNRSHVGIFFASVLPAVFLSLSTHSTLIERLSRGATRHALYVPAYLLITAATFWITVAALGHANHEGMEMLARRGWLFAIEESAQRRRGMDQAWMYWKLFDLNNIEWHAMKGAVADIALLVLIGVLNLPLFIPMLAYALDVPSYDMDREFWGHGAANILAGVVGTLPNLVVFSNSVFFTRAGGGRFEASFVILLTLVLFFVSSHLLPYIPTILSCALVVFLGLELIFEAVWDSAKTLVWSEWLVVMSTLLACTFLDFALGIGVGIGSAIVVHFAWGVVDARVRVVDWENATRTYDRTDESNYPMPIMSRLAFQSSGVTLCYDNIDYSRSNDSGRFGRTDDDTPPLLPRIGFLKLTGYVFFAVIPSLETEISRMVSSPAAHAFIIIDFTLVNRLETTVTQFLERKFRQMASHVKPTVVVLAGIQRGSGVVADFDRAGVKLTFSSDEKNSYGEGIVTFEEASDAVMWCKRRCSIYGSEAIPDETIIRPHHIADPSRYQRDEDVLDEFATLFKSAMTPFGPLFFSPRALHRSHIDDVAAWLRASDGVIRRYGVGQTVFEKGDAIYSVVFIVSGCVRLDDTPDGAISIRPSFSQLLGSLPQTVWGSVVACWRMAFLRYRPIRRSRPVRPASRTLFAGDWFGPGVRGAEDVDATVWSVSERVVVSGLEPCVTVEIPWKCVA